MKTTLRIVTRMLPAYGVFPLVFSFIFNCLVYSGSRMIAGGWYHHNIETGLDRSLPFVPQFLVVYFGCYLFWAVNYILIARQDRHRVYQFFTGVSDNQYKTGDHRCRSVESGGTLALFGRCGR